LDHDHPLNGWYVHIRCDLVVKEVAKQRRPVTEVDVGGEEAGGGPEGRAVANSRRFDAEIGGRATT
jgi:hypothetical protein